MDLASTWQWFGQQTSLSNATTIIIGLSTTASAAYGLLRSWYLQHKIHDMGKVVGLTERLSDVGVVITGVTECLTEFKKEKIALQGRLEETRARCDAYENRLPETFMRKAEDELRDGNRARANHIVRRWITTEGEIISRLLYLRALWKSDEAAGDNPERAHDLFSAYAYALSALVFWPHHEKAAALQQELARATDEQDSKPSTSSAAILAEDFKMSLDDVAAAPTQLTADAVETFNEMFTEVLRRSTRRLYLLALSKIDSTILFSLKAFGAHSYRTLAARCIRMSILNQLGRYNEGLQEAQLAAASAATIKPDGGQAHRYVLRARAWIAMLLSNLGQNKKALDLLLPIAKEEEKLLGRLDHQTIETKITIVRELRQLGRYRKALEVAIAIESNYKEIAAAIVDPEAPMKGFNPSIYRFIAEVENDVGFYKQALQRATTVAKMYAEHKNDPSDPEVLLARLVAAQSRSNMGGYSEALEEVLKITAIDQTNATTDPGGTWLRSTFFRLLAAETRMNLNQYDLALADATAVAKEREAKLGATHLWTLVGRRIIGTIDGRLGHFDKALATLSAVAQVQLDNDNLGASHPETLKTRYEIAEIRSRIGDVEEALKEAISVLLAQESNTDLGPTHPDTLRTKKLAKGISERGGRPVNEDPVL